MIKIIKYYIIPIIVIALFVVGVILLKSINQTTSSIGAGLISSSIVSIIIWGFQIIESINHRNNIKNNLYNLIKREFIIKLNMVQVFLLNDNRTLCVYLCDLSKEASKCHKEKQGEEDMLLYLERFICTENYLGIKHQILRLLDYSLSQNIISIKEFDCLNHMFQYEIAISRLLKEGKVNDAICFFSYFLDYMLNSIKNNKNLKIFSDIIIKDDEFFIDPKKISKKDRGLFNIFVRNEANSK